MNDSTSLNQLHNRLSEAFDDLWSSFVDPRDAYCDDEGRAWGALGDGVGSTSAQGCAFQNEQQLAAVRNECRALAVSNEFAINGHENRVNFIVGAGHNYRATDRKHADADASLTAEVQQVVDEFLRINHWTRRQQEIVHRLDRDGEVFLRYFATPAGLLHVRFVEPGQVAAPDGADRDRAASFGIVTNPDDVETVHAYYIDGIAVPAHDVQNRKAGVDANVKRGLPLYYPVRKNLRRAEKLLRNMSTVAEIQSAIALIRKHQGTSRTAVQQFVAAQPDSATTRGVGPGSTVRRFAPGTILDAYGNVDYDFPAAALDAASYVAVLQAELRAIAARLVMPEFMLTSDASNGNYASTLVAESPAVRMFQRLQARQIADDREVLQRAIATAVAAGRLNSAALTEVELQIEAPSPAVRDAKQEADVHAVEFRNGILSPQTWCLRAGLDYDREQANWDAHRRRTS